MNKSLILRPQIINTVMRFTEKMSKIVTDLIDTSFHYK